MECLWECGELPVTRGEMSEPRAQLCGMGGCRLTGSVVLDVKLGLLRGQHGAQQGCQVLYTCHQGHGPTNCLEETKSIPSHTPPTSALLELTCSQ